MNKIVHTTISPCDNERRIFQQAASASSHGMNVAILALKTPQLPAKSHFKDIPIRRIKISHWKGGPLKFLIYNWKLFWRLVFTKFDILHAHDLWVLSASSIVSSIKGKPLIYDAHEFYAGLEIFLTKKSSGQIWLLTERILIRFADALVVINREHGRLYHQRHPKFDKKPVTIMNFPSRKASRTEPELPGFAQRQAAVIFQGIFKKGRGLTQTVSAMSLLEQVILKLVGYGELDTQLRKLSAGKGLNHKVEFCGKMNLNEIVTETQSSRAGLVLFEPTSVNYKYASPNKFFEYVMAGTPVIASNIPTFRRLFRQHEVGILVNPRSEEEIANAIQRMVSDAEFWERLHRNCLAARKIWNWEAQEPELINLYHSLMKEN